MKTKRLFSFFLSILIVVSCFNIKVYAATNAVTTNTANVRSGAGIVYDVIDSLTGNTPVEVIGRELSWYNVKVNNKTGFIADNLVTINDPTLKESLSYVKYNYEQLATYTTYFSTGAKNRNHNIELSAYKNYITIQPGETFSFNKNTGNSNLKSAGWREAGVIVNKKMDVGVGGGICQTSSTVHSAVRQLSNLKITERYPHSIPVGYVSVAQEAMVNYPTNDFKFRNDYSFPIVVASDVSHTSGSIKVGIYKINSSTPVPKPEPEPEPFDIDADIKRVYSEKLIEIANKPEVLLDIFGISQENAVNKYYDIKFTIHDINNDGTEDLMLNVTTNVTRQINNEYVEDIYDNFIVYTYEKEKIKEVISMATKENGYILINEMAYFKNKETGNKVWFRKDFGAKEAYMIEKDFELSEPISSDILKHLYDEVAFNKTNISAKNIEDYKKSKSKRPEVAAKVIVNGDEIEYNVPPQNIDKRLYVEVRSLFETLGYNLIYNEHSRSITIFNNDRAYYLDEGVKSKNIRVVENSGEEYSVTLELPPKIVNDRTMFSLRLAGELLGYEVFWDENQHSAILVSDNYLEKNNDETEEATYSDESGNSDLDEETNSQEIDKQNDNNTTELEEETEFNQDEE